MFCKLDKCLNAGVRLLKTRHLSMCLKCISKQNAFASHTCCGSIARKDSRLKSFVRNASQANYGDVSSESKTKLGDNCLVYYGLHTSKLKGLKVFSLSTSVITLLVQPIMYENLCNMSLPVLASIYTVVGFFTFMTPLIIYSVTKRYVTEIIYNPADDSYVSKTMTFFLREKAVKFKMEDIVKIDTPGGFSSFSIKGQPVIVFIEGFLDRKHYNRMMGFDKPIDFKLELEKQT